MWIDTHCHLDGDEFDADRDAVVERARAAGVSAIVMPTGHIDERDKAAAVAQRYGFTYALGIHPLWLADAEPSDIDRLRAMVPEALADPRFVAIGEIGVDLFEPGLDPERQQWFYREQLKVARDFALPVIVHVRRSADLLLKHLRAIEVPGGIIHAFNASAQQAQQFIERGFKLGFGGALYGRSGRGPTSDMSPRSTFQSCGSSSRSKWRRKRPNGVQRGSSSRAKTGPVSRSAPRNIERNL